MQYRRDNEKIGMIVAAAVAAISVAAFVLFDFGLGSGVQPGGLSMVSAAVIERAGASAVTTESPRRVYQLKATDPTACSAPCDRRMSANPPL
jgi:hypothetical protein